jgi:hypothetical protein
MKTGCAIILINVIVVAASCRQDKCGEMHCPPEATCFQGICYDSCYGVVCLNGGICNNGICECAPGFGGADCSAIIDPVFMVVTKIVLQDFPEKNANGGYWDGVNDAPDVLMTIDDEVHATLTEFVTGILPNCVAPLTFDSDEGLPVTLTDLNKVHTIGTWDNDGAHDQLMDDKTFTPIYHAFGLPSIVHLSAFHWSCDLYVEWKY